MNFNVFSVKRVAEKCTDCTCIESSGTCHLINQFYTSRISVRFVKAGSESPWSTTLLAWSQLCTDAGICWTGPAAGSGTLALAWQTISWSSSILCVNTLIRVTRVCSSRVTENSANALGHSCLLFSFTGTSLYQNY